MDKAPLHCAYDNKWKGDPTDEIISQRDADHEYYTAKIRKIFERMDEFCPHILTQIMDGAETKKRECGVCWQQLKKEMGVD